MQPAAPAGRLPLPVCNASRVQLKAHHRTYERRGSESSKDLVVLCADCHDLFHRQGKLASDADRGVSTCMRRRRRAGHARACAARLRSEP
jgi:hypothetical protein